jgi:hypothetical protein
MEGRQSSERAGRVVHQHHGDAGRELVGEMVDHETGGPAGRRLGKELMSIQSMPFDGKERRADPEGSAVDGHSSHRHPQVPPDQGAPGGSDHVLHRERWHGSPYGERSSRI